MRKFERWFQNFSELFSRKFGAEFRDDFARTFDRSVPIFESFREIFHLFILTDLSEKSNFVRAKIFKMSRDNPLISVEISRSALENNFKILRESVGEKVALAPMVKANAYGHGLEICAKIFRDAGAEYLAVNSIFEAEKIRATGDAGKIYIAGFTPESEIAAAVAAGAEFVVFNFEILEFLEKTKLPAKIHLKVETGTNRQGVQKSEIPRFLDKIRLLENVEFVAGWRCISRTSRTRRATISRKNSSRNSSRFARKSKKPGSKI